MKRMIELVACLLVTCAVLTGQAGVGAGIGDFSLASGDGKHLASAELSGMITVLFYESKDDKEVNRPAKDQLSALYHSLTGVEQKMVTRLSVIDCTGAFWPFISIWEKQLADNSKLEGLDIFGDWDGKMKKAFSFETNEVYMVIIDQNARIRYLKKGPMSQADIDEAAEILKTLL